MASEEFHLMYETEQANNLDGMRVLHIYSNPEIVSLFEFEQKKIIYISGWQNKNNEI